MGWIGEPRKFQVWEYTVSHGQLLLRSVRDESTTTRIDVLFKDVKFIAVSTTGVLSRIEEIEGTDVGRLGGPPAEIAFHEVGQRAYLLEGPVGNGLIVAGVVVVHEDELEWHEPSVLPIWPMRSGKDSAS